MNLGSRLAQAFPGLSATTIALLSAKAGQPDASADMPVQDPSQLQDLARNFSGGGPEENQSVPFSAGDANGPNANAHSKPASWSAASSGDVELASMMPGAPMSKPATTPSAKGAPQPWNAPKTAEAPAGMSLQNAARSFAAQDQVSGAPQNLMPAGGGGGGGAPATTTPAHWQPGSHAVSIAHGIPEEALADGRTERELGYQHAYQAANDRLDAAQKMGQAEAAYNAAKAAGDAHGAEIAAAREAEKRAYVADEHAKLEALSTQAQKKVDPNEYWKEKGTGSKIAAALAIGLGTFGSLYMHGPNTALQIINEGINANIDAQKANIATARGAFADRSSLYRQNLEAFGDRERADLATKMQYLDQVTSMVNQIRAGAKDADSEAARHDMLSQLYMQRAKYADQFGELTSAKVTEQGNEHFVPAMTMGGGAGSKREGNLVTLPDGTTYRMQSEKLAEGAIGKIQVLGQLQDVGNRIVQLRKETADLPVTEVTRRGTNLLQLKKLTSELEQLESAAFGQGVVTKEDHARNADLGISGDADLGTLSGINPFANSNREVTNNAYKDMVKRWGDTQHRFAQAAGGEVYDKTYQRAADGSLVPTGNYTGQDAKTMERLAPEGSKPMDSRDNVATAGRPDRETIPHAPLKSGVYSPPAGGSRGGNSRGSHVPNVVPKRKAR